MRVHKRARLAIRLIALFFAIFNFALIVGENAYAATAEDRQNLDMPFYSEIIEEDCETEGASGGPANINVDKGFSLGTNPTERRVNLIQALMNDYGLTSAQASGIVGNFMEESGGKHLPPNINQGGRAGPPAFDGGYGWAQWTGGRQRTFVNFAVEGGYMESNQDEATDAANYAYLKKELAEGYTSTIEELKTTSTPEEAAASFHRTFERSGDNATQLRERGASARQAYDEFVASEGGVTTGDGNDPVRVCNGGEGPSVSGDVAFPLQVSKSGISNRGMFNNGDASLGGHPYTAYDILVPPGTPVLAFMAGRVVNVTEDRCPGRMISIYNETANMTISYLHMAFDYHVQEGETVQVGQQVGVVGPASAGCGTPHLHIDAVTGDSRPGCSRLNCPQANRSKFVSIGPQLYETFQGLPE